MQKVKKRDDGRYQAQVYIGVVDGKRKYKYVYADNQRALDKKVQELKIKLGKGIDVTADRDTFDFWGNKWLNSRKTEVSYNWYKSLEINYKKLSSIYCFKIAKLVPIDLQDVLINLANNGYSKRVIKAVRDIASSIMQFAADNRAIDYNVFASAKIPKSAKPPEVRRALTQKEQQQILDTPHRAQTAAMIMMYARLRRGELIALTWEDIDLKQGIIIVSKSVEMIDGNPVIKDGGKTECATRTVYMPKPLIDYLNKLDRPRFTPVCPTTNNGLMTDSAWRRL